LKIDFSSDFYKGLEGRDISAFLGSARVKEGRRADKRFKNNKAVRKRSQIFSIADDENSVSEN